MTYVLRSLSLVVLLVVLAAAFPVSAQVTTPPADGATEAPAPAAQEPPPATPGMLLVKLEEYDKALPLLEAELKEAPKRLDLHQAKVDALEGLNRYVDARGAAMQGLFVDPKNGQLRIDMGYCSYQMGQMDQAIGAWKPLLSNPGWRQSAIVWTARALRAVGKEQEAKTLVLG